ncbi:MAG: IPT/TIG domain-containing protein [Acidobacteriaceae bacterium]
MRRFRVRREAANGNSGGTPSAPPTLNAISPSSTVVGSAQIPIVAYGSKFQDGVAVAWNGTALSTSCVDTNLIPTSCSNAAALSATVPAADLAATGTATVTLSNPSGAGTSGGTSNPLSFTIGQAPPGNTWVRAVTGISVPNDIVWDAMRGKLYASISSSNPTNPSTIAVIDPVAGTATSFVPAGNNPNALSISSNSGYLWAGLDGNNAVQRFLLPGLTQDISFPVPANSQGNPQLAVGLQAAPVSAHSVALVAGSGGGNGVYVYDDATARAQHVPGYGTDGGPLIDWVQWGADDTTLYGDQYTTEDAGGIATLRVNPTGVALASYAGGLALQPTIGQYDRTNGLLYSYGGVYDPVKLSLTGIFDLPESGAEACTPDSGLGRYYCVTTYSVGGTDITAFELWVFDLQSHALLGRTYFGSTSETSASSTTTGRPNHLVRWGNAGLALLTYTGPYYGSGGIFLIDGAAVNPESSPDVGNGASVRAYGMLSSMTPDSAITTSGQVEVTIKGAGFSPDSTACWNCNYGQLRFLPTTYISSMQLNVTIPLASVSSTEPQEISVFDQGANLFSSNALTFTVLSPSPTTQVTPLNLRGLAMTWDNNSQLLYVGTADYDAAYPNSIVAIDPTSGAVVKTQQVESDPTFLSESAGGQYLYAAYNGATDLTQVTLPGLNITVTAPLRNPQGNVWYPGDLKAAPQDPHTVAASLIMPGFSPEALGGVTIFDDGVPLPTSLAGWTGGQTVPALYDTLAWSASDQLLTSAPSSWDDGVAGPLYQLQVASAGVSYLGQGTATFDTGGGYIHSDFGTGLIYSDGGSVADPHSGAVVGSYAASGLAAPDSSLNRVFILGQTAAQANTNNYTIESFDQKAFTPVGSIPLNNVSGSPIALVRWGAAGLAVLTAGGLPGILENGSGMLYVVQATAFVSSMPSSSVRGAAVERVQQRWKRLTTREILANVHHGSLSRSICCSGGDR